MTSTDIRAIAKIEYQARMKERLAGMPMPLEILMQSDAAITQEHIEAINKAVSYDHREDLPEAIRPYLDLYHQLTGQEPTKRSFTDWVDTGWTWKDERLQPDDIRAAWAQAQEPNKGFTVGRPGALTVTAIGMKSKSKPAIVGINSQAVGKTQALIQERKAAESSYIPMPDDVRERLRMKLKGLEK